MGSGKGQSRRGQSIVANSLTPPHGAHPAGKNKLFQLRGQRMLMQRIGVLKPVRQRSLTFSEPGYGLTVAGRRNPRAPEARGIWAFPYPFFDPYFASFQFSLALPKWLNKLNAELDGTDESYEAYEAAFQGWQKTPEAKKVLQVKNFWVSGSVYTHLGDGGGDGEWQLMPVTQLAGALKKQYAKDAAHVKRFEATISNSAKTAKGVKLPAWYDHNKQHRGPWPTSTDHLEVFIGKDAKIR